MKDCSAYYKEVSDQLFIFYRTLYTAGFSDEQASIGRRASEEVTYNEH